MINNAKLQDEILSLPKRTQLAFDSVDGIRAAFSLPVTMGTTEENRLALDMAFDAAGGYDAIYQSLTQHAAELGQYPMTSFIGYGALQQIAQNGMIRACIQTVSDDITRKWIEITGGDDTNPERVDDLTDIQERRYKLQDLFHNAATMTGYMGGAFIFIDTGAEDDDLQLPLAINNHSAELVKNEDLRFVLVDPINVTPGNYNSNDPLKPNYMTPQWWWVLGKQVHASRMITLLDNPVPTLLKPSYNFLGIPQAQILWDYVLHWNDCRVSTAKLLNKLSLLVMQTDTDAIFSSEGGLQQFDLRMEALQRYRTNDSVFVCDKTDEAVSNVQTTISGCTDVVRQSLEMIAAINRTPAVKLLGISPSGFNATGESDITNYYDYIHSKQELRRSAITKCLNCIQLAEYGEIDPSIDFDFSEQSTDNESSIAMTAKTRVEMLRTLQDANVVSAEEVRQAVKQDQSMRLDFIGDELPEEPEEQEDLQSEDFSGGNEPQEQPEPPQMNGPDA